MLPRVCANRKFPWTEVMKSLAKKPHYASYNKLIFLSPEPLNLLGLKGLFEEKKEVVNSVWCWMDIIDLHCTNGIYQKGWFFIFFFLLCQQVVFYSDCSTLAVRSKGYKLMCFCESSKLIILDFTARACVTYWHIVLWVSTNIEKDHSTKTSQLQRQ